MAIRRGTARGERLDGSTGNDSLFGLVGSDRLFGLAGNDLLDGGSGNELDNQILGTAGADVLTGGDGNDLLDGHGGADVMSGGPGDDRYVVDDLGDRIDEAAPLTLLALGFQNEAGDTFSNPGTSLLSTALSAVSAW